MSESHDITNLDLQDRIANNTDFAVATIAERDAIQTWRRKWGMLVVVFADSLPVNNQMYVLRPVNADLGDNSNWSAAESPAWGLAGNAGTNPAAHFIGTTDNQPVVVRVNNVEQARFLSTGFDLVGRIRLVQNSGASIRFDTTSQVGGARNWAVVNSNQAFGDFCIIQSNALGGDPLADGTIRLYFDIFGNIGINTFFPEARLDVNGTVIVRDSLKLMAQATDANHAVRADRAISAGAGLSGGGDLAADRTLSVVFGTTAGTVAQGNDSRIINGQTAFGWGNHAGLYRPVTWVPSWNDVTGKPTTLSGYGITDAVPNARTVTAGAGLTGGGALSANITISHADTSSQASVDNSNGFVIQDITLDTYGHITGLGSVNLDSRYYTETEIDSLLGNYVTLNTTQTITGLKTFTSGIIGSDIARIIAPGGAVFRTVVPHVTGAIRITLPASTFNNFCMMAMKVVVYNYSSNTSRIFHIGGYTHVAGPSWVNTFATQESDVEVGDMNVRFGRDATNWYIYIGETNSNWLYPQVMVTEFLGGFAGASSDYATGWDIDFVTSFATVTSTIPARTDVKISGNQTITGNKIFTAALSLDTQATAAVHAVRASRLINAGTGLSGGGDLTADRTLSVVFGTTAGTVAQGNNLITAASFSGGSSTGNQLNLTRAVGGLTATFKKLFVLDARAAVVDGSNGTESYLPLPNSSFWNNGITGLFHFGWGGSSWGSSVVSKGWTADYQAWMLSGPATMGDAIEEWYLRTSNATTDVWKTPRRIWHSGNFNPAGYQPVGSYALTSTSILAGNGLTGGGTLAADRTLSVVFGTTAGTVAQGNDSRIINGQTAFGWGNHAGLYRPVTWVPSWNDVTGKPTTLSGYGITDAVPNTRTVTAGAGLSGGGDLTANRSLAVVYGATANSAVQGNVAINIAAGLNMTGGGQLTLGAGGTIPVAVSANPAFDSINLGGIVRNTWPAESPAWGLAGNAGTNPAAHFIGTTDNQPVVVRVNNVEQARFLSTGFDLVGRIRLVQDSLVSIQFDTTSQAWGARNWAVVNSTQTFGDFCIIQSNDLGGDPLVDGTIRLYFDIFGNIGINTFFPEARLDVNGTVIVRDSLKLMAQATDANHAVRADRAISAGAGLSGGGDLTANRTLSVVFGTTAGTVAQGNDSRIINGQTAFGWGNHAGLYINNTSGFTGNFDFGTSAPIAAYHSATTGATNLPIVNNASTALTFKGYDTRYQTQLFLYPATTIPDIRVRNRTDTGWHGWYNLLHSGNFTAGTHYQAPLTNPVTRTGSGTTNYLTKWSGLGTLTESQIFDNGTNVGIGTTNPIRKLDVNGIVSSKNDSFTTGDGAVIAGGGNPSIIQRMQRSGGGYAYNLFEGYVDNSTTGLSSKILAYGAFGNLQSGTTAPTIEYSYFGVGATSAFNNTHMRLYNNANKTVSFDGSVGIGTTSPTAVLHLKAGTVTAGTAPLKFTSGTNLTTAEAGAMEYDGTNLYFTPSGTTRKTIAYTSDIPAQVYPGAGIAVSTGSAWGTSITDNSANWNTAFGWGNHAGLYRPVTWVPSWNDVTGKPTTLSGYGITDAVPNTRTVTAGAGLSGGGDLTANRSLAVVYGATANSAVQGNVAINIAAGLNMTGGGQLTLGAGGTIPVAVSANPAFDSINLGGIVRNTWPAGAPGGDATQIQYNRAGEFAGALFYYDETASIIYRFDTTPTGRRTILGVQNGSVTQFSVMSDGTIQTGNDSPAFKIHKFSPTPTGGIIHINIHNTNYTFEVIL